MAAKNTFSASPGDSVGSRGVRPFAKSFMVELANGYYGYMPTPRHFELGGYETWPGTNNLEPQASVKMMDALLEMANEIKAQP